MKKPLGTFLFCLLVLSACVEKSPLSEKTPTVIGSKTSKPTITPIPTQTSTATPTRTPTCTPTLIPNEDLDNDGLTNYEESEKYKTDPWSQDSDGDGLSDFDWDERRENVYSVRLILIVREPFNIETMNDLFQDARLLDGQYGYGYSKLEILLFPDTQPRVIDVNYPMIDLPEDLLTLTESGISTNYSPQMQLEITDILDGIDGEMDAVREIISWIDSNTDFISCEHPPMFHSYVDHNDVVFFKNYRGPCSYDELLNKTFYSASMFNNRVHESCLSIANLKCGMLKAGGIPCRIILTVDPLYFHPNQPYIMENLLYRAYDTWSGPFEANESAMWVDHGFIEYYINGLWLRADRNTNIYHDCDNCLSLKLLSISDWSEITLSNSWPTNWINDRPYYVLLIEDQEPLH